MAVAARVAALACIGLMLPAAAAGAGWDPYPGVLDGFAVDAAVMGRDGTATVLYSSEDPGHDAKPSVPLAVSRAPGGAWGAASGSW